MRNLCLVGERRRHVGLEGSVTPSNNGRHIVDTFQTVGDGALVVQGSRFVLTNDGILTKMSEDGALEWISHLDNCTENPGGLWFNMAYLDATEEEQIACISKNGAIVAVSPVTGNAELCGQFEHGLEGACWSPDRESVLLLTFEENDEDETCSKKSVLLLMNSQWEVLAETTIDSHIPSGVTDESSVSMSIRPDGSLCAISTVDAADNVRKVRFFKRESLEFHAIGRTEDGSGKLVPNINALAGTAWAGAGCSQLLAAAQRKGKKTTQIIFFEPNGLRHREFPLRENPSTEVLRLAWNVESDLLAICLREPEVCDKVQLWHRSNYHWYLKQELRYKEERIANAVFDEEKPYTLYTYFERSLEWREYEFLWQSSTVHVVPGKTCTAYAIDGSQLNTTPLDTALVPPPMYAASLDLGCPVRQISFCGMNDIPVNSVVHLSDNSIVLLKRSSDPFSPPQVLARGRLPALERMDPTALRSFVVLSCADSCIRILAVASAESNTSSEKLVVLTVAWEPGSQSISITRSCDDIQLQQTVSCAVSWSDASKGALLGLVDGSLWELDVSDNSGAILSPCPEQEFVESCQWIAGVKNVTNLDYADSTNIGRDSDSYGKKRLVFGLSSRSRLYCRDVLLADAVSSFFVSIDHQFLSYATAQGSVSQLRFLPLKDLESFDILLGSDENHVLGGFDPRSVERGARIVAILPNTPQAVLQVPRGNLEGIFPRALVLRFVMNMICSGKYGAAFTMMRRQKVNLNLIVDLNPRKFLENDIPTFLSQVVAIDHLNLFISCLQNWDSTNTQYRIPPWFHLESETDLAAKQSFDFSNKINKVCIKMRSLMIEAERDGCIKGGRSIPAGHFLLPILSTFAKEVPSRLEDALTLVKENAEQASSSSSKKPPLFSETSQSSIQYLAFLADYELLFETALGMYDYDLARAVARNSQMDPKKYLPLLKHYREVPRYFGRYEVDMRLKRYEKALQNLCESMQCEEMPNPVDSKIVAEGEGDDRPLGNSFEDCMKLISTYKLHSTGLELFREDQAKKHRIMLSLGESLMNKNQAASALTVFLATDPVDVAQAKKAARSCRNWKSYFSLSLASGEEENGDTKEQITAAREIAEEVALASEEKFSSREGLGDAARILLDYCEDVNAAVDMLLRGKLWQESCRVSTLHGRKDLVQKSVEASVSFAESTLGELEERKTTFVNTIKRYDEVLEIRKEAMRLGDPGADEAQGTFDDAGSVFSAASNASNMSLQSNMSSDSLSSVISIKSTSSFSISGAEEATRHKSKFNQVGGKSKKGKKKKKKQGRNRVRPGSAEELKGLVETLRSSCIDEDLCKVISDTIEFLSQSGAMKPALELYKSYVSIAEAVQESQDASFDLKRRRRLAEPHKIPISLPEEEEVLKLSCPKLSAPIYEVFSILRM